MEKWRNGRRDLLEELSRGLDRIDADLTGELDQGVIAPPQELQQLRESSSRLDGLQKEFLEQSRLVGEKQLENTRLIEENAHLRVQLQSYRSTTPQVKVQYIGTSIPNTDEIDKSLGERRGDFSALGTPVSSAPSPSADSDPSKVVPKAQYTDLVIRYNALHSQYSAVKGVYEKTRERLKRQQEVARNWTKTCGDLKETIVKKDEKIQLLHEELLKLQDTSVLASTRSDSNDQRDGAPLSSHKGYNIEKRQPDIQPTVEISGSNPSCEFQSENNAQGSEKSDFVSLSGDLPDPRVNYGANALDGVDAHFAPIEHNSSSTEGDRNESLQQNETDVHSTVKTENDVLSSPSDEPIFVSARNLKKRKRHDGSVAPTPVPKIKQEIIISSPVGLAALRYLDPDESLDLDEIGEKVNTPKKRRRFSQQSPHPGFEDRTPSQRRRNQSQARAATPLDNQPRAPSQGTSIPRSRQTRENSALQRLSCNRQIVPKISASVSPEKYHREVSDKAINDLLEDGQISRHVEAITGKNQTTEVSNRLNGLLTNPPPVRSRLPPTRALQVAAPLPLKEYFVRPEPKLAESSRPSSRSSTVHSAGRSKSLLEPTIASAKGSKLSTNAITKRSPKSVDSTSMTAARRSVEHSPRQPNARKQLAEPEGPFRARPVDKLGLEHFKINPGYNQGYDYAFKEVIRNQADRRCLQGCTKPECCGNKFRALAKASRDRNHKLTLSQEQDDQRLLEDFLGDNSYTIPYLTKEQRVETILQAKTRELANKYGTHRHAYTRRKSPPGFWDADFPTTQEDAAYLELAIQEERALVVQRYMEAMRPGGAYLFADE
ncbi:hypothetical protein B7494_g687 [Chlorociboria aeruginascens]|nr:hypothetical protein B7494_g687 [Chlorociboria aeruginascens]